MRIWIFVVGIFIWGIIFSSCREKIKLKPEFRSIEYSYSGQVGRGSIKIDSLGNFFFKRSHDTCYYFGRLSDSDFVKLNNAVRSVKKSKIDTLYSNNGCADCGSFRLIIESDSLYLHTTVEGGDITRELLQLEMCIDQIRSYHSKQKIEKIDTTIDFKTSFIRPVRVLQDSSVSKQ